MSGLFLTTTSSEETMRIGALVAQVCASGDIIALEGELGAGKTQFVRGLARGLGLNERRVSSPTFVTVQEYWPEEDEKKLVLVHIDAWRMDGGGDELEAIGWGHEGAQLRRGAVVAVEWPSRMGKALGRDFLEVRLSHGANETRQIFMVGFGAFERKIQPLLAALRSTGFEPQIQEETV